MDGMALIRRTTQPKIFPANRQRLINAVVIAGLLLVVLGVSYISRRGGTIVDWILAGAVSVLAAIFFVYRYSRYEIGLLAIALAGGLLNFFTLPTGRDSRIVISLVIAIILTGLWLLQMLVSKGKENIRPSPIKKPTLLFIAVGVIAYFWSTLMRDPLVFVPSSFTVVQIGALIVNSLLPFLALFVSSIVTETRWLKLYTWALLGVGALIIFSVIFNIPLDPLFNNGYRGLFATWVCAIGLAMALFNEELSVWKRGLLILLVAAWFYQDFLRHADWYSGWLPMAVSLAAVLLFRSRKLFAIVSAAVILMVILNFNYFYQNVYVANYYGQGGNQRWGLWDTNIQLVERHPLFGMGPAGYAVYYMTYNPNDARSTHNNYFDVLAQTGVIGFGVFLWLMGTYLVTGNRLRQWLARRRNFEEAFAVATLAGSFGVLMAMMLGDWVLPFAYNQTISGFDNACFTWIFLGGMISLYLIVKGREHAS
jgi:O-antigen ligase